jgi:hypothetical protein
VAIWYIFLRFGSLCQEKSGNPAHGPSKRTYLVKLSNIPIGINSFSSLRRWINNTAPTVSATCDANLGSSLINNRLLVPSTGADTAKQLVAITYVHSLLYNATMLTCVVGYFTIELGGFSSFFTLQLKLQLQIVTL